MNESRRRQLQDMIEEATRNNGNRIYLHILSQYRLLVSNLKLFSVISLRVFYLTSCLFAMHFLGDE